MEMKVLMQCDIQKGAEEVRTVWNVVEVTVFAHFTCLEFVEGQTMYVANGDLLSITPYVE